MNLSYWCVLIAGILPAATVAIAKWGKRDFDNSEPRRWLEQQEGLRRRADSAHRNHFEACLLYTSPSPRDRQKSRMPSSA